MLTSIRQSRILTFLFAAAMCWATGCGVPETVKFDREFGKTGSEKGDFKGPVDIALTPDGDLVIADVGNDRIQIMSPDGSVKYAAGEKGKDKLKFVGIAGVGVNPTTGDIWVCDYRGAKLVCFDKTGNPTRKITERVSYPQDVAVDKDGNLYVVMANQPAIFRYDCVGKPMDPIAGQGPTALTGPLAITIQADHIYVAENAGRRISKLTLKGALVAEFRAKGEYETMMGPTNLYVGPDERIYMVDLGEVPVVVLGPKGELISKIGSYGKEPGTFIYPRGIMATDKDIWVLDSQRNALLRFKKPPVK